MPSMQQRKVKPLEGVVYLLRSENIVAVKIASSLYKLSLQTRETQDLPKDWKDGIIVPVFKKGRRKDSGNYRGISLLSIAEKIWTRILLNYFQLKWATFTRTYCLNTYLPTGGTIAVRHLYLG